MSEEKLNSYQERLKRMKDSVNKNKEILDSDFPDDVTIIGNPDFIKKPDDDIDEILENDK